MLEYSRVWRSFHQVSLRPQSAPESGSTGDKFGDEERVCSARGTAHGTRSLRLDRRWSRASADWESVQDQVVQVVSRKSAWTFRDPVEAILIGSMTHDEGSSRARVNPPLDFSRMTLV
jgi:hypothetical protein